MSESHEAHLSNVLGAFAVALADRIQGATEAAAGMTGAAPAALVSLHQFIGGRTTEELAHAIGLTHSGAVRLVDRLADAGFVERRPGRDGRSLSIVLTSRGRTLSKKVTRARAAAVDGVLASLSADERRDLTVLVDGLVTSVTDQRLDARDRGDLPTGWLCRLCDAAACGRPQGECPAANAAQAHLAAEGSAGDG